MSTPTLDVQGLTKHFPVRRGIGGKRLVARAVDGVDLRIGSGEILGLVGESGSGKTTVGKCVMRLLKPTAGRILLNGEDITETSRHRLRPLRRQMQIVFQNPYSSLNPRMRVGEIVQEPLILHDIARSRSEIHDRVGEMLQRCGLGSDMARRFPHQLSGGQRQRVGLARALVVEPSLVVADEPVSALDVSVRASILNLFRQLQEDLGFSSLFISHDLSTVEFVSDRICVMYLGKIVEEAPAHDLMRSPKMPYTQALLSAIPLADPIRQAERRRIILSGTLPSPIDPPSGCSFRTRCPLVEQVCVEEEPELVDVTGHDHLAACHLIGDDGIAPDASRSGTPAHTGARTKL